MYVNVSIILFQMIELNRRKMIAGSALDGFGINWFCII